MKQKPVIIKAETFKVEERDGGVRITGLALPFGKRSRNGLVYNRESVMETVEQWRGLPILFNHDENKPIGHVVEAEVREDGLYYKGDIDPAEEDMVRKIKRGDIRFVSIQAIVDRAREDMEGDVIVKEWLELSVCTIPGFPETSIEIEKFIDPKDERPPVNPTKEDTAKEPFAGFKNWDDCIKKMKEQGYDEETAKKICGALKRDYEEILNEEKNIRGEQITNVMTEEMINQVLEEMKALKQEIQDMKQENTTKEQEEPAPTDGMDEIKAKIDELVAEIEAIKTRLAKLEGGETGEESNQAGVSEQPEAETFSRERLVEKLREV